MSGFLSLFATTKPLIGMVHCKGDTPGAALKQALNEIEMYELAGIDAVLLETYFGTAAVVQEVLKHLHSHGLSIPYGVNILNVDLVAFWYAHSYGAHFVQVDSVVGHVQPRDEESLGEFFRYCHSSFAVPFMGGVRFKYQPVLSTRSLAEDLVTAMTRCDAICVTADATGQQTPTDKIAEFRQEIGDFPLFVCSGVTPKTVSAQLQIADGAVIGSAFKDNGRDCGNVDRVKVGAMVTALAGERVRRD